MPQRLDDCVTGLILGFRLQRPQQRVEYVLVVAESGKDARSVFPNVRIATVEHLDRVWD